MAESEYELGYRLGQERMRDAAARCVNDCVYGANHRSIQAGDYAARVEKLEIIAPPSRTRPWVDAFADEMEAKLAENRHKGDRAGWSVMGFELLMSMLHVEVGELERALVAPGEAREVRRECADVANIAMMIADVAGGLRPKS